MRFWFRWRCAALVAGLVVLGVSTGAQELRRAGFFGVQVVEVPDALRRTLDPAPSGGVLVQALVEGGSAKTAGVLQDDVITEIDGHRVAGVGEFVDLVRRLRAGDTPVVRIARGRRALTIAVPVGSRPFEKSPDADVRYDAVAVDGTLRRTIVTSPRQPGRHPAVVYVNGIGCFSQESLDLTSNDAQFLYGLTRAGFATLRVEKSGMGDSEGPPCGSATADFAAEVRAYTAGLRAVKRYPFVDADAVFLAGISIGGVEAPLIAAQEQVRGIVVINTVAKPFFEYLLDTRRRQLILAHTPHDEIDRRMMLDERCNHALLVDKQTPATILATTPACADHIAYPAPATFMQQWADVNPAAAWKAVAGPVLIVYGTSDFISSIADDAYLAEMINAFHPGAAAVRAIDGMDHTMNKAATMAASFERDGTPQFEPRIVPTVVEWLSKVRRP